MMADCCKEIRTELAALRAEVAKLQRVDEESIIKKSVARSEASIVPRIDTIAGAIAATVFNDKINPFASRLTKNEQLTGDALEKARQGLEKAFQAGDAARTAGNTANNALGKAGQALAKYAGLATAIAGILIAIGTLKVLGSRIDALERYIDSVANGVSKALSVAGQALGVGREAKNTANKALDRATSADSTANRAISSATQAEQVARDARNRADNAQNAANEAKSKANQAEQAAKDAKKTADDTRAFVQPLPGKIDDAKRKADDANKKAEEALKAFPPIRDIANNAKRKADEADRKADDALKAFPPIRDIANNAKRKADEALQKANDALRRINLIPAGKPGKDGLPGKQGIPGNPGRDGLPGKEGKPGKDGKPGRDGKDGKNGRDGKDAKLDEQIKALIRKTADNAAFIPALVARPAPLNLNETINAASTGVCRTTQPGGCTNKLVNNARDNINQNANNWFKKILDNLKENPLIAATFQQVLDINNKMGAKLVNGLSGAMNGIANNQIIHTIVNYMTLVATFHNALMLSNDIGQTLFSAIDNVLKITGLAVTDANGQAVPIGNQVNQWSTNFFKALFGEENYTNLTTGWAKANRIYQAGINVINTFQGLASTILNALEITIGRIGKIGNALRQAGEVLENAYSWMNPQPKINRVTQTLENLSAGASTIQMVTQAPLDIINATTELTNATTEFNKSFKEDNNPANSTTPEPEPDKLKADKAAEKIASAGQELADTDFDSEAA